MANIEIVTETKTSKLFCDVCRDPCHTLAEVRTEKTIVRLCSECMESACERIGYLVTKAKSK